MRILSKYKILLIGGLVLVLFLAGVALALTQPQQWTIGTLKEYVDLRFTSVQEAVTKAEAATEKRFEGVNEFRSTLADQQRTFVPRSEYEAGHVELSDRVDELRTRLDKMENMKQGGNIVWTYVISGFSLLIAVFAIKDRVIKMRNGN